MWRRFLKSIPNSDLISKEMEYCWQGAEHLTGDLEEQGTIVHVSLTFGTDFLFHSANLIFGTKSSFQILLPFNKSVFIKKKNFWWTKWKTKTINVFLRH